jgi:uncharacterized membrane protein YidH (DUF202 family)
MIPSKKTASKLLAVSFVAALFAPALAFAQLNLSYLQGSGTGIIHFINSVAVPLLIGIAVIIFIVSTFRYVLSSNDSKAHGEARGRMIWGVIAIFVIVSVWGFVNILQNIFGVSGNNSNVTLPTVPGTY